jgi:hypothetical protein
MLAMVSLPLAAGAKPAKKRAARPRPAAAAPAATPATPPAPADDAEAAPDEARPVLAQGPTPPKPPPLAKAAEPEAGDAKEPALPATPAPSADLQKLRADYDRLRDELYRARARAQVVQEGLYTSKLGATVRWKGAPGYTFRRAELRIDGASAWDSGDKPVNDELIRVAERAIKPGPHALTLRLEIRAATAAKKANVPAGEAEQLGYVSEHTFAIVVPEGKHTTVEITGDEDGKLPEYEPEIEVEIQSEK